MRSKLHRCWPAFKVLLGLAILVSTANMVLSLRANDCS
jgi:hypothetical protein